MKLTASDGAASDSFGVSVSLDGDNFLIGAYFKNSARGKAYSGSVSSMTTLDTGNASRTIDGISFISQDDWIIGQSTDANQVILTAGDTANVTADGKAVYIGKNADSDHNQLAIDGILIATDVYVGAEGNTGNSLFLSDTAVLTLENNHITAGNFLIIEGDYIDITNLLTYLGSTNLNVWDGSDWLEVNSDTYTDFFTTVYTSGQTHFQVIPEPGTCVLLGFGLGAVLLRRDCPD